MPPPRLPRHLRPCRPPWSAQQARFASDKPSSTASTAGGDRLKSARSPKEEKRQDESAAGSSSGHRATPGSQPTAKELGVHSRGGRWRRDTPAVPPAKSTKGTFGSQAQRMRDVLGAGSATNTTPKSRLHKVVAEGPRAAAGVGPEISTTPGLRIHKHLVAEENARVSTAIRAALEKKVRLESDQQSRATTATEDELRERLRSLEEQLAALQKRLETGAAAHVEQSTDDGGAVRDQEAGVEAEHVDDQTTPAGDAAKESDAAVEASKTEGSTLAQQIQAQANSMRASSHQQPSRPAPPAPSPASDEVSEQSLLDELFPEASSRSRSRALPELPDRRPSPPKLELPAPDANQRVRLIPSDSRTDKEKAVEAFRTRGEQTTVLQLSNCSTALTEADFRRLVPKGLHIETWSRDGEFYKIIPGRDPLSLERLPFYYLLFHTPASALAYQKNAARLSKLSALHAPNSIHSAIAPPAGFLEDGEDIHAINSAFVLHPTGHSLDLRTVMQPYNRALRALIDAGGYTPIVPSTVDGKKIHRVLLHIDGYEPSHWDLWQTLSRHAHARGIIWPFHNDHASALRRLRDAINLTTLSRSKFQATSTSNPRAAFASPKSRALPDETAALDYEDANISSFLNLNSAAASAADAPNAKEINQLVMNRVYNRWIVEFEDEDAARRFAGMWHRVVLPEAVQKKGAWRESEEARWVGAEYLW